jgi:hypothetical protein
LWGAVALLLVALLATLGYKLSPFSQPLPEQRLELDESCDLNQTACTLSLPTGGQITLSIEPRPVPVVTPLQFAVQAKGIELEKAELDFSGVSMNMGYNRFTLKPDGSGGYTGSGILPVCIRNRMDWEASVLLTTPERVLIAPFRFVTYRQR